MKDGYKRIYEGGRRIYLHRYLLERLLDRKLNSHELVHHFDGDKKNNCIENLVLTTRVSHPSVHRNKGAEEMAVKLYEAGFLMTKVAKILGVSQPTIKRWLEEKGKEPKGYKRWLIPRVLTLKKKKLSNKEIAKLVGLEEHAVGRWVRSIVPA